jgi:hypothetical protein
MSQRKKRGGLRNPPGGRPRVALLKVQEVVTFSCSESFKKRLDRFVRSTAEQNRSRAIREAITEHIKRSD